MHVCGYVYLDIYMCIRIPVYVCTYDSLCVSLSLSTYLHTCTGSFNTSDFRPLLLASVEALQKILGRIWLLTRSWC